MMELLLKLHRRVGALEVVAVHDLTHGLIHGVAGLLHVYLGNDVE